MNQLNAILGSWGPHFVTAFREHYTWYSRRSLPRIMAIVGYMNPHDCFASYGTPSYSSVS